MLINRAKSHFVEIVVALAILVFSAAASMAAPCKLDDDLSDLPDNVWVELYPSKIYAISETASAYDFQFFLGYSFATDEGIDCEAKTDVLTNLFDPSFEFSNARNIERISPYSISMSGGEIYIEAKYSGTFINDFDFRLFPFDTQKFRVELVSFYSADDLNFTQVEQDFSDLDNFSVFGWVTGGFQYRSEPQEWKDESYQNLVYEITLSRQSKSHSVRMFLPLIVIVVLNFISLLMPTSRLDNKVGVQVSALVAIAAYSIVLGRKLPDLPYLIVADAAISMSFVISALILAYTMLRSRKTHT